MIRPWRWLMIPVVLAASCASDPVRIPSPADKEHNRPAAAVYIEDWRLGSEAGGGRRVIAAAWRDGRLVWSGDPTEGGPPYYEARISPARIPELIAKLERRRAFRDSRLKFDYFAPDSRFTVIRIEARDERVLKMRSWHELYGDNEETIVTRQGLEKLRGRDPEEVLARQPRAYRHFMKTWDWLRAEIESWIPEEGKPLDHVALNGI